MSKIIIDIQDNTSPELALGLVSEVIGYGRISDERGIRHYCWVTKFTDGMLVITRSKKTEQSADSFIVRKSK